MSASTINLDNVLEKLETHPELSDYDALNSIIKNGLHQAASFATFSESIPRILEIYRRDINQGLIHYSNNSKQNISEKRLQTALKSLGYMLHIPSLASRLTGNDMGSSNNTLNSPPKKKGRLDKR
jgi:hypothetical protein